MYRSEKSREEHLVGLFSSGVPVFLTAFYILKIKPLFFLSACSLSIAQEELFSSQDIFGH